MTEDRTLAADLRSAISQLTAERDVSFANSLLAGFDRWQSFTDKQRPYVLKLIEKTIAPVIPAKVEIGSLEGIFDLFKRVKGRLKDPQIMLETSGGQPVSVGFYRDGLKVTNGESRSSGLNRWYGSIDKNGVWTPNRNASPAFVEMVLDILTAFANDPAGVAAQYGILTGRCCFCHGKKMTAPASKAVGYGPVCAKNYGLPWGKNKVNPLTQYAAEEVA